MKIALVYCVMALIASVLCVADVSAAEAVPGLVFTGLTPDSRVSPLDDDRRLLPFRNSSSAGSGFNDASGISRDVPQAATVEAIPTPTAFHAGALLLATLFFGRYSRKLLARLTA